MVDVDGFQRNQQIVPLFQEVSGQDGGNVQLPPRLLRVDIVGCIFLCARGRANIQAAGVGKHIGDFVGQREAKKLDTNVAVGVLQGQHGNRVLGGGANSEATL